jgi:putative ABC transport system permease protein
MNTILKDIRFAFRNLVKRPSFTIIVILVLGLGIGSTTAIFSIVDALLLRSLPYPNADRLVLMREVGPKGNQMSVAESNFQDVASRSQSFEHIGISAGSFPLVVTAGNTTNRTRMSYASTEFFAAMGVQPIAGRTFLPEEEKYGGPIAVVVSYGYWQKMLGGRSDFTAVNLNVDGVGCNVVGVMPPTFDYPAGTEVWITRNTEPPITSRTAHNNPVIGLLRSGTSLEQARADVSLIAKQLKQTYGEKTDAVDFALVPLQTHLTRNVRQGLWLLLGSVGLLLLVACANFSNLLLGQLISRQREFTLRVALGASRARLTRQVLVENLVLTLPGALLGVLLASFAVRLLLILEKGTLPRVNTIAVDSRVMLFACALGILIAIVLSFLPGLRSRHNLNVGLKSGARQTVGGRGSRLRGALVVGQIGLTLILLTGAGLLARSFFNVMAIKPGFDIESTMVMTLSLPTTITPEEDERIRQFYAQLLDHVGHLPGVNAVGGINVLPLQGGGADGQFLVDNDPNQKGNAEYRVASAGYFDAMRIPLLRGRMFDARDKADGQHVAVISQSLAQRYWPNDDAIGKRIQYGNMDTDKHLMEIVGIVADVRDANLERPPEPTFYGYSLQRPQWWQVSRLAVVIRTQTEPQTLIPSLRNTVQSLRSDAPVSFSTLKQVFSDSFDARRFSLTLFVVFGVVALLITVIGLYGMLSYSVTERTREMGIRMALGAQRSSVLRLVIRQGLQLAAVGVVLGLIGAWGLTRLMTTLLFGVTPTDSVTLVAVVATLALVALIACYVPARRATKVDPLVALREE